MKSHNPNNGRLSVLAILAGLMLSLTTLATAESDAARGIRIASANVPTNIPNIRTYAEAPKGFDPAKASDEELATYGFPLRPDKQADPDHYALWERAMKAAKIRYHGELKPLLASGERLTMPASAPSDQAAISTALTSGPARVSNPTVAGVTLDNKVTSWGKSSFNDIWTVISVPVNQLPFDNTTGCTAAAYYSWSLTGIDGQFVSAGGPTVFVPGEAAGVFSGVDCSGAPFYYASVGWGEDIQGVFAMNPGDMFYTEIHAFGGCNNGSAFIEDLTTLTYNSYTTFNPCGLRQIGRFANWVVHRPCCNGNNSWPLANTIGIFFDGGAVLNGYGTRFNPGSQATSTTIMTMTDDAGDQPIELVNQGSSGYEGQHGLWFQTTGCAFAGGCNP